MTRAFFVALMVSSAACAAAPPVEQTVVELPAPLPVESAVVSTPSAAPDGEEVILEPPEDASSADSVVPSPFPFPLPPIPGVAPTPLSPFPGTSRAPVGTTTPALGAQSKTTLTRDLDKALALEVPGATPLGPHVGGTFSGPASGSQNPSVLVIPVVMEPGKCYSVVAVTRAKVELSLALHVDLQTPFPMPLTPLGVAKSLGPKVVFGGGNNCFKLPLPMPMPTQVVVTTAGPADVLVAVAAK